MKSTPAACPILLHFVFTSVDEISSCSITIHRLMFPDFMHQNALTYSVSCAWHWPPKLPLQSMSPGVCPESLKGLVPSGGVASESVPGRERTAVSSPCLGHPLAALDRLPGPVHYFPPSSLPPSEPFPATLTHSTRNHHHPNMGQTSEAQE